MRRFGIVFVVVVTLFTLTPAHAQSNISVEASVDALSGYLWRGGVLGADDKFVLQPSLTFGLAESGFSFNIWGSFFAQDRTLTEGADELDFTLDYSGSFPDSPISFSIGYIQYTFPNGGSGNEHSEEAYGSLSFDHTLAPSVTLYYDFGLIEDYYVALGVGPEIPLSEEEGAPSLALSASVGFSGDGYGGKSGWNDVTIGASVGFVAGGLSITPLVGVTFADDAVNPDTSVWGGVSFGVSN
ncbi:MAG: hypothetical protein CME26_07735 [Gemmatimonadetes bacterium]|nr:hypothetical protein [Gemmatimonadota bacterium]|tara:strand:- start:3633 stop:4355 length:723 start_codon:yes stop_codon:yes gene_type:complete